MTQDRNKELKRKLTSAWDVPPMSEGSRNRFLEKLKQQEHPHHNRARIYIGVVSAIAAVLVICALILRPADTEERDEPTHTELTIAEVKGYYKAKIWSESEYIIKLTEHMDEKTRNSLLSEIKKMEHAPDSLIEHLRDEPISNDLKIYYVTQIYQSYLHSMQQLHSLLDERTSQK